ncbi:MAG: Atxe2 family lasso peptide isopeptidase [Phenylobacterium sp.]|jgi:dipeptidyl aminopeptidase/acylaminoacyl peptidase|nr:Atxe2 family lasso peptide isopeptidase [Phenylobacterium sp.]
MVSPSLSRARAALLAFGLALAMPRVAGAATDWAGAALGAAGPSAGGVVTTDDELRLRDLGAISLSSDGAWLAFSVRQARPETNDYVLRWFVLPTRDGATPVALAQDGGQPIPGYAFGMPQASVPPEPGRWSPTRAQFAFRRLVDHRIELWLADPRDGRTRRIADGVAQVTAFGWTPGGDLVFRTGLNYVRYEQNLDAEAARGWLQDGRVAIVASQQRPTEPDCTAATRDPACEVGVYVATAAGSRLATPAEATALVAVSPPERIVPVSPGHRVLLTAPPRADGARLWVQNADPAQVDAMIPLQQVATDAPQAKPCRDHACLGGAIRGLGWARGGASVWFLKGDSDRGRADGAPFDLSALYEWRVATGEVRQVWRGGDLLDDCHVAGVHAYCALETSTRPRRLVEIDLDSGTTRVLADPNPQFADKRMPRIRKLDTEGLPGALGFAHLVYPTDYDPRRRYPLVVVQYLSSGFLRGGVGNETPILPLSAEGFFVLSTDHPVFWEQERTLPLAAYDQYIYGDNLRERRSIERSIETTLDSLVGEGLVDSRRIAITGLSAGAEVVHYALQHSDRYAAAIASSGAHDLTFLPLMPSEDDRSRRERRMTMFQTKSLVPPPGNPLYALAWSQMPERLHTPFLINAGEHEALMGFEGLEALKAADRPIEVRVFPDEYHFKYHPRSFAGVYGNAIAWLKFWLQDVELDDPARAADYARWRAMRARLQKEAGSHHLAAGSGQ